VGPEGVPADVASEVRDASHVQWGAAQLAGWEYVTSKQQGQARLRDACSIMSSDIALNRLITYEDPAACREGRHRFAVRD